MVRITTDLLCLLNNQGELTIYVREKEGRNFLTKHELASLLFHKGTPCLKFSSGQTGIVQSIRRESGSGRSFIVEYLDSVNTRHGLLISTLD